MKRLAFIIGVSVFASVLCLGCGGGGSDGGVANLQGTWLGWIEDDEGIVEEFSLQIDGAGNVTDVWIDGDSTGDTAWINEGWDENVFHILYNIGNPLGHGIMIVDDQYSHAVYGNYGSASSDFFCGVLEKGAMSFPAYTSSDIIASFSVGGAYEGDSGVWEGDDISMTVDPALTFTGSVSGESFYGSFDTYDPDYGRYAGTLTRDIIPPVTMDIAAFICPDGEAVAAFATDIKTTPDELEDFILIGLTK